LSGAGQTLTGQGTTVNVGSAGSIQNGVNVASTAGATVTVADGNYAENVTINKSNLTLLSENGRDATTITGQVSGPGNGAVYVNTGSNNLKLGGDGKGFTIVGFDSASAGLEKAAVYIGGSNSGSTIEGNRITAAGEAGLLTDYAGTLSNLIITGNIFDGVTFVQPTAGNGEQFTAANVPRSLLYISGGSGGANKTNIEFSHNEVVGTAGGFDVGGAESGNTLVTIDAAGATITDNNFAGTTTKWADALRVRGSNTTISGNSFDGSNMTASTYLLEAKAGSLSSTFADVAVNNTWKNAAWVDQLVGGSNYVFRSVQSAVSSAVAGDTVNVAEGTYAGTVVIDEGIALQGTDSVNRANLTDGIQLTGAYSDLTLKNLVVSGDGGGNKVVSGGSVTNLTVDNVKIDGGNVDNRFGFAGGKTYGDISITNSQFVDINGWAAFDNSTGGSATALTSVNFSNNLLDNVQGHIAFRQLNATDVTISGNTVRNTGTDTNSFGGIFKVFKGGTVDFEGNTVSDIGTSGFNPAGEAAYGAVLLTRDVTTLNVTDNIFTNNNQVFAVEPGKALPGTTNFSGNTFTNNGYAIYTPTNISGGGTINFSGTNNFISGANTVQHIVWRSASALDLTGVQFGGKLGSAMTNAELFALEDQITHGLDNAAAGLVTVKADNVYVTENSGSIARGVSKATAGDTVNVGAGSFALGTSQLNINKGLIFQGAGIGATNISTTSSGYGIYVTGNDVTLSGFTFNANPTGSYSIKVSPGGVASSRLTNFDINNVTVDASKRTGLDLNGVNGATIDNVTVTNTTAGNGITLTDSANVTVTNSTTSNNAWGGLAIYQGNFFYDQQVDNIQIDGTNSFANGIYAQDQSGTNDFGVINLIGQGIQYVAKIVTGGADGDYTFFQNTKQGALDLADAFNTRYAQTGATVQGYTEADTSVAGNNNFYVGHATNTNALSIAAAVGTATSGGTVNVDAGNFALGTSQLNINKGLTLAGAGEGATNISSTSAGYGINVTGNDVTLSGFTFNANPTGSYSIKVSPGGVPASRLTNFAIDNVAVNGSKRTGLDLNGVLGATIDNVTVTGTTSGNGITLTDSADVTITNSTTSGNAWGGLAIYQDNNYYDQQTNNITVAANNSFGEVNSVYLQDSSDGTTNYGGLAGLDYGTLNIAGYNFAILNAIGRTQNDGEQFVWLQKTQQASFDFAMGSFEMINTASSTVQGWTGSAINNTFYVGHAAGGDAMSIAAAQAVSSTGNTINVGSGNFAEAVTVDDARNIVFDGTTITSYTQNVASAIGGTVTAAGGFVLNALTSLVSDTVLNGDVTAASINGTASGNRSLTVNGGAVALNGSSYKGSALSFGGTGVTLTQAVTTFDTSSVGGDITFTGPIFGTTDGAQSVVFNAGPGTGVVNGDISMQNAGTDTIWLGDMTASGNDLTGHTVYVGGDYNATLTGDETFTTDTLHTRGDVTSTVGGNATGPINAGGTVNVNAGGNFSGNVNAPTTTVTANNVSGTFTGSSATLNGGSGVNATTNVTSLTVNAPSGTINGTFNTIDTSGSGPLNVNGQTRTGDVGTNPNQIVVEGFTLPAGAFITASGEIVLPGGMLIGLVSPAAGEGAAGGAPKVIIVHSVRRLGELLAAGYVAIVVDLANTDDDEEEEIALN
tara:strand:- start:4847 stop:9793 length:4947 start_codon:yes stop_codon:yes gene_type:complete